ncbi:hypothetical protein [Arcicella rigui]|uniref:Uncharacterized protein n=1 Tax=Arcicella rigui TaxID=797020 RepID=A0ABU5QCQ4_9BACT|nr:hypothetical protein [Arcicella rigui]MEA5140432.1 hypothetical protein [Arcicella rigui]
MFPAIKPQKTSDRKRQLQEEAKAYKKVIEGQVEEIKSEAVRISTTALIIGTVLVTTYWLFDFLVSDTEKKKVEKVPENTNLPVLVKKEKSKESWVVSSIKGYMMAFLIAVAKDKLIEALTILKENHAEKPSE